MGLSYAEKAQLLEVLREVKPYIVEMQQTEKIIEECLASAHSFGDFISKVQKEHDRLNDSVLQTDLRIYISRLRKTAKCQRPTT